MPQFPIHKRMENLPRTRIILGPCPGCELWTVEYDLAVVFSNWTSQEWSNVVEHLLRTHAEECPGLREIIKALHLEAAPAPGLMKFEEHQG